jgi:ABC-type dipeptide/oligopeptide/nickel transport system permease subunit
MSLLEMQPDKALRPMRRNSLRSFFEHKLGLIGLAIVVLMVAFSFIGPLLYRTDQIHTNLNQVMIAPGSRFPLGTDDLGYNVLGRLMVGGQSSLEIGVTAALLAACFGTIWGAVSGYAGGAIDALMMRIVDTLLAIPALLLLLLLASVFTPTIPVLIFAVSSISWLVTARMVRGQALALREKEFVEAVAGFGGRRYRIVLRHIVPNVAGTVVVQATFEIANAILLLAALSFLGLGPPAPSTNWGSMLSNGLTYAYDGAWWLIYPAGVAIVVTVVAFNFLGEALRDTLEVRLQTN